jgi:hypothetical protein
VFTAAATEPLKAVSTYVGSSNSPYVIRVYTGVTGAPSTGTLALTTSGTFAQAGYFTVVLPQTVALTQGQKFAVVMELTTPGTVPIPFEAGYSGYSSHAAAAAGQGFVSLDGSSWTDAYTINLGGYIAGTTSIAL